MKQMGKQLFTRLHTEQLAKSGKRVIVFENDKSFLVTFEDGQIIKTPYEANNKDYYAKAQKD